MSTGNKGRNHYCQLYPNSTQFIFYASFYLFGSNQSRREPDFFFYAPSVVLPVDLPSLFWSTRGFCHLKSHFFPFHCELLGATQKLTLPVHIVTCSWPVFRVRSRPAQRKSALIYVWYDDLLCHCKIKRKKKKLKLISDQAERSLTRRRLFSL